ncbi:MAG: acyltransferase 3 [Acidimicrobiales bacterium]|jgi:peptidoglycan/LPS O-acetylase OafA/YrhL|nr:acyltransferase 3 [Acidimicrobiales bacterium]
MTGVRVDDDKGPTRAAAGDAHFPCFDGLRAIAAGTVLVVHTAFASGFTGRSGWGDWTSRLEIGVAVFFLISGFLLYRPFVGAALSGKPPLGTKRFLRRRLLRILPAYFVALTVIGYVFGDIQMQGFTGAVLHYGFLQIYSFKHILGGIGQAWSLCTEMTFYLFLPFYAWLLRRTARPPEAQVRVELIGIGALTAISFATRIWIYAWAPTKLAAIMPAWLPSYFDLFAAGMFLAVVSTWWRMHGAEPAILGRRWVPWLCWALAFVAFWAVATQVPLSRKPLYHTGVGPALARQSLYGAFGFLLLIPAVFGPQHETLVRKFLRWRPIAYFGLISYGVYIWHELWITEYRYSTGGQLFHQSFLKTTIVDLVLTVITASLSYYIVERPFLKLKDRPLGATVAGWFRRPSPERVELDLAPADR